MVVPNVSTGSAEQFGGDAGCNHAGCLALIVRGADGGVALDVFHRPHPGLHGAGQVGDRGVTLHVDELGVFVLHIGHPPQHQGPRRLAVVLGHHLER